MAVELVRVVADHRALSWVAEFLDDEDSHIQVWGVGVLDQLLWSHLIEPEAAEDLLRMAERHQNEAVRERAEFIRSFLKRFRFEHSGNGITTMPKPAANICQSHFGVRAP
jgi:hypothetical protein